MEKETIILWNEEDEPIVIDTFDAGLIARLNKASAKFPDAIKVEPPDKWGCVTAKIEKPFLRISFVAPLTDAQRAVMSAKAKHSNRASNFKTPN